MTRYLLLYRSSVSPGDQMANASPEEAQAGMEAWMKWAANAGESLVDLGSPLASVAKVGKSGSAGSFIGGFSIMQSDSPDGVTRLLDGHPHLMGPGDNSIEVLEFLPIPGA
jgi:hypothetical protein